MPPDREPNLVVGVREPEVTLDPPIVEGMRREPRTTLSKLKRAVSLIRSLRASGFYEAVDFEGQLESPPDLLLEVHENPQPSTCDGQAAMVLIYGGIIPMYFECDHGHYFSRVDEVPRRFEFPWHETHTFGWIMPLFLPFPQWTWRPPPRSQHHDVFRSFLRSHESELLRAEPPGRSPAE